MIITSITIYICPNKFKQILFMDFQEKVLRLSKIVPKGMFKYIKREEGLVSNNHPFFGKQKKHIAGCKQLVAG